MPPPSIVPQRLPTEPLPPSSSQDSRLDSQQSFGDVSTSPSPIAPTLGSSNPRVPPPIRSAPIRRPPTIASAQTSEGSGRPYIIAEASDTHPPHAAVTPIPLVGTHSYTHVPPPEDVNLLNELPPVPSHVPGMNDPLSLPFRIDASQIDPQLMIVTNEEMPSFSSQAITPHALPAADSSQGNASNDAPPAKTSKPRRASRKRAADPSRADESSTNREHQPT